MTDKQKIWLYEARARRIVGPFSEQRCYDMGIVPFTVLDPQKGT